MKIPPKTFNYSSNNQQITQIRHRYELLVAKMVIERSTCLYEYLYKQVDLHVTIECTKIRVDRKINSPNLQHPSLTFYFSRSYQGIKQFAQVHRCVSGGMIRHGIWDDQFVIVDNGATGIDHIGHISFAFLGVGYH